MIYYLILSCTVLSLVLSLIVMVFFSKSIHTFLSAILPEELSMAWSTFMRYMIVIVGLGGGVNVYQYKKYLEESRVLTTEYWVLELYETLLNTLSAIGWMIFWLFLVGMIAFIILKIVNRKKSPTHLDETNERR